MAEEPRSSNAGLAVVLLVALLVIALIAFGAFTLIGNGNGDDGDGDGEPIIPTLDPGDESGDDGGEGSGLLIPAVV